MTHKTEIIVWQKTGFRWSALAAKTANGLYTWPTARMDTNTPYILATQWLNDVSMDVKGLNRDCQLIVEPDPLFTHRRENLCRFIS